MNGQLPIVGGFRQNQAHVWGQGFVLITDGPRELLVRVSVRKPN